jgi:AcrR family transcriptional regulator
MPVEKLTPDRRRQLTRDTLMDAAAAVFADKGMGGASMEEIAAAAGFTRGAIYSNFGSKEELLLAVMDRYLARQFEAFKAVEPVGDLEVDAHDAANVFRRTTGGVDLVALELELRLNALRNPMARQRLAHADRRDSEDTAQLIEDMIGPDVAMKIPPRDLGDIGRAAIVGLLQFAAVDEEQADRYQQLIDSLFVLLAGAVEQSEDAARKPTNAPAGP